MTQQLGFMSATRKKRNSSFSSFSVQHDKPRQIEESKITDLFTKFQKVNSSIQISHNLSNLNLVEYELKTTRIHFDKEMVTAKLKQLQNKAELKKATMELSYRNRRFRSKKQHEQAQAFEANSYINIYKTLSHKKAKRSFNSQNDSQEEEIEKTVPLQEKKSGIKYYSELQKRPKLLDFTLSQIKSKRLLQNQEKNKKNIQKQTYKNQINMLSQNFFNEDQQLLARQTSAKVENVAENLFRRIYSKKRKERENPQAKKNFRVNQFMQKQDQILQSPDRRSLSKSNLKKLKQNFNQIANLLYQGEKKHEKRV